MLIFGEQPEPNAHSLSVVMSDLSNSLTSLFKKKERANCPCFFKLTKNKILFKFFFSKLLVFESKRAIERFAKKN